MKVIILPTADDVGDQAARVIIDGISSGTLSVLGVATGSSPLPIYRALAKYTGVDLTSLTAYALDEYVGLAKTHPQSYQSVINTEVTLPLSLDPTRVHVPDGSARDIDAACAAYDAAIANSGGIDLQILGIGSDGHIGFNEPTSSFASRTRVKTLAPQTRADNARFFDSIDEVPIHCITQGLGTIMEAKQILLVALGSGKADAIAAAVEGPITSMCPASILQMHPNVTVILDSAASSGLRLTEYYDYVAANLPAWQR
ncbi:glucosamine-6-phosphate deaminase [Cryobacterium sp. Hh7]|uniref:glucosamine-6-phosphate deaminase n=1 Tax=Cryobacterium sp. Hh7 TaxID=1259159 RepID=UPI00106C708F|nr:glucosamine-6-phosphate deaminase [Cryobacterium sp. Hh7]TFD62279.1 glucosamine-6-phosphate deaminase [Cryobacterium sp. Hh7]